MRAESLALRAFVAGGGTHAAPWRESVFAYSERFSQLSRVMISRVLVLIHKARLHRYKKRGLQIADDCRLMGMPFFGSEPYLISIAKRVTISGKVTFITHDGGTFVFRHLPKYEHATKFGRITVHENSFIGWGAIIMPGVTIGPNAVVAAGSVVTRDVPPDSVVAGVPARRLCSVGEYAEKTLATHTVFTDPAWKANKREELLKRYPYPW